MSEEKKAGVEAVTGEYLEQIDESGVKSAELLAETVSDVPVSEVEAAEIDASVAEADPETVSDAIEDARPEDGQEGSDAPYVPTDDDELDAAAEGLDVPPTDDEVVEQSETIGEEAADDPTDEELEADRRNGIRRNFSENTGRKGERKRETNAG